MFACHDAVGLLLVVRLIERARTRATRGPAPTASALDAFLGDCEALVRPRLLTILTQNLEGVKKAELSRLGVVSTAPHYVARRYGELHATVLALFPDECRAAAARDADVASPPASPAASPASPALRKIVEFASRRSSVSSTASAPTNGAASAAAQAASLMEELREDIRIIVAARAAAQEGQSQTRLPREQLRPHLLDFCGEGRLGTRE